MRDRLLAKWQERAANTDGLDVTLEDGMVRIAIDWGEIAPMDAFLVGMTLGATEMPERQYLDIKQ